MKPWHALTHFEKDADVLPEMVKKYKNTILRIIYGEKTTYAYYRGYSQEGKHIFNASLGLGHPDITLAHDTDCFIDIPQFVKGYRQLGAHACYLQRKPFRQFRKGLCSDNTQIQSLYTKLYYGTDNEFGKHIIEALAAPIPNTTITEGIKFLQQGARTYALTLDFAISHNHYEVDPDSFSLFFGFDFVGFVNTKTKTIKVVNEVFIQEIVDTQHELCPDYKLEV